MEDEVNPTKVRIGLAIIGVVVLVALGLVAVIDSPLGKAIMFAVAVTAFVRAYVLYRALRREQQGSARGA